MMSFLRRVIDALASYKLACLLFVLLLLLTFLGTLEQVEHGIYEVTQRYFESIVVIYPFLGFIPIPLPGAYLLLALLSVNLFLGGVVRMRKNARTYGVLIAHIGILLLIAAGFVKHQYARDGYISLYEGERAHEYESYFDWEFAIWRDADGPTREYLIDADRVGRSRGGRWTFRHPEIPFELTVANYLRNSVPRRLAPATADAGADDGFALEPLPLEVEAEANLPGAYAILREPDGTEHEALLWGGARHPFSVEIDGAVWSVDLRRLRRAMPFTIALNRFVHAFHPNTTIPSMFMSEVTRIEEGVAQDVQISMNEPMRHRGYTLYQASWGPQDAPPGAPLFSTFAVAWDPAEDLPLWACVVITIGLVFHFGVMLTRYLRRENRRQAS